MQGRRKLIIMYRHNKLAFMPSFSFVGRWLKKQPHWMQETVEWIKVAMRTIAIGIFIFFIWRAFQ